MALLGQKSADGTKKLLTDARVDLYVSILTRGEFSPVLLNRQMAGYQHSTTSDKAQTTAIYVASLSRHGLIELSSLWAAKTLPLKEPKLDALLKKSWSDLGESLFRLDV